MIRRLATTFFLATLFVPGYVMAQSSVDIVTTLDGESEKGEITVMDKDKLVVTRSGIEHTISVPDISSVVYAREPIQFRSIQNLFKQGDYQAVIEKISTFPPDLLTRNIMNQELEFDKAYSEGQIAFSGTRQEKETALTSLKAFIQKYPGNYHFYTVAQLTGDLYASLGDYENAEKAYMALYNPAWEEYKLRSGLLTGDMRLLMKDYAAAEKRFDFVIQNTKANTTEGERRKLLALLGKAQCLAASGNSTEGLKIADKVIAENDPADAPLFSRAYLAKGACYLSANKLKEAALAYLHVDVLYFNEPMAHAEALYNLNKIWLQLKNPQRAIQAKQTLKTRYSSSAWAQKP